MSWSQLDHIFKHTFKVFNDFNVVQGQIQILQFLQTTKVFYSVNKNISF